MNWADYIPQGHRFNIYEDVGCFPYTYNSWVGIVVVNVPCILIGLVSGFYAISSIISLNKSRMRLNELLSNHPNLNSARYVRLMLMAGTDVVLTVPLNAYVIYQNTTLGMHPWISWDNTHWRFARVDQVPALVWRSQPLLARGLESTRWFGVMCGLISFAFFGFGEEARKHYRSVIHSIFKRVEAAVSNTIPVSKLDSPPRRDALTTLKEPPRRLDSFDTLATIPTFFVDACPSRTRSGTGININKSPQLVTTSGIGGFSSADFEKPLSCLSSPLDSTLGSPSDVTKVDSSHLLMEQQPTPAASIEGRRKSHMNHHLLYHFRSFLNLDSSSVSSIRPPPPVPTRENPRFDIENQDTPTTSGILQSQRRDHRSRSHRFSQHLRSFLNLD